MMTRWSSSTTLWRDGSVLKKEQCIPGALLKIRPQPKSGIPAMYSVGGDQNLPYVTMTESSGSWFDGHCAIYPGAIVTVVRGPKRVRHAANTTRSAG